MALKLLLKPCVTYQVFKSFIFCRRCYCSSLENKINLVQRLTDCSNEAAAKVLKSRKFIDLIDEERILMAFSLLKGFGISKHEIASNLKALMIHPVTLKHHFMVLQETGIKETKCNCRSLIGFYKIIKCSIQSLKSRNYITNYDFNNHYSVMMGIPPEFQKPYTQVTLLSEIHKTNVDAMLKWKSGGVWTTEEILPQRLSLKSIRLLSRSFDLLTQDFGLSIERVCKYPIFLNLCPDNLECILKNVPFLGGNIREFAKKWPKILYNNWESLQKIDNYLKEFNISQEAIYNTPAVFTLTPENVLDRLKFSANNPDILQWEYHPQYLLVVMYHNKVKARLTQLKDANMECMSLHLLKTPDYNFNKHVEHLDKSYQYDIVKFISIKLSCDVKEIRSRLRKHPYWLYIPHKDIQENLLFLKEKGFSNKDIVSNIILLLYPKTVVEDELSKLDSRYSINLCRNPETGKLRQETILPLVLYMIEKPFNFSKDTIWAYKNKDKSTNYQFSVSDT